MSTPTSWTQPCEVNGCDRYGIVSRQGIRMCLHHFESLPAAVVWAMRTLRGLVVMKHAR